MSDYTTLKAAIDANINTNGNQEITGAVLNSALNQMVDDIQDQTDAQFTELESKTLKFKNISTNANSWKILSSIVDCKIWTKQEFPKVGVSAFGVYENNFIINIATSDNNVFLDSFIIVEGNIYPNSGVVTYEGYSPNDKNFYISITIDWDKYCGISHSERTPFLIFEKVGVIGDDSFLIYTNSMSKNTLSETLSIVSEKMQPLYEHFVLEKGNQRFNIADARSGGYYSSSNGAWVFDSNSMSTNFIDVRGQSKVWTSQPWLHCAFFDEDKKFISGLVITSAPFSVEIPTNAVYATFGGDSEYIEDLMVNFGEQALPFEQFNDVTYLNDVFDKEVVEARGKYNSLKERLDSIPDYDSVLYELPFIKNKKVCCNKAVDAGTAYYIGVDTKGTPNKIISKFIMEQGNISGTVALILQKNGLNSVEAITSKSFHIVITSEHVALNLLLNNSHYTNPIDTDLINPLKLDGVTENIAVVEIEGNNVSITINEDKYTGVLNDVQYTISDFVGRYAQFEHYCNGDRDTISMPMFTYFEVRGDDIWTPIKDNFNRPDGLLDRTPQGYKYAVFTNINSGY